MKSIPVSGTSKLAMVDDIDYERLIKYRWHLRRNGNRKYAQRNIYSDGRRTTRQMHQDIMPVPDGCIPDHRDGNGLNNTRDNIRPATFSQNAMNRRIRSDSQTGIKGVSETSNGKWRAYLQLDGKTLHLGTYASKAKAARIRAEAAARLFGEFVRSDYP